MIFIKPLNNNQSCYGIASHLSTLGECEESDNEESKSEEGDESEFEPLTKRPCSTRSGRHASSFIL